MININLSYDMILKLEIYMENEIKDIAQKYRDLSWRYQEKSSYDTDMKTSTYSFHTNYNITKEDYETYSKSLQVRQYETFLELEKLIKLCKEQNGGHGYIGYTRGLKHELIRFNPSYDSVIEMLERLKSA